MKAATEIEKQNLEAHVEICAVRYASLETKLENLESRMDKVENHLLDIKTALMNVSAMQQRQPSEDQVGPYKTMITIGTAILGVLITGIITFIVK
jgi:chaperonin cofactor prefoldin